MSEKTLYTVIAIIVLLGMAMVGAYAIDGPPGQATEEPAEKIDSETLDVEGVEEEVTRFTDPETGNTCYVLDGGANPSISCVNSSET